MREIRKNLRGLAVIGGFIGSLNFVHAQAIPRTVQSVSADDMAVMLQAVQATTPVAAESVPRYGLFYSARMPMGPPLPGSMGWPAWNLGEDNFGQSVWLLDDLDQPQTQARAMGMATFDLDGNSSGDDSPAYTFDANVLWLEITHVADGQAYLNLHNATNQVYAIWSTTNLLANWNVETELWPTNLPLLPFTVPTLERQNLFMRAEDWTGVDSDSDGIPDWWIWKYFGDLSENATNLDSQGHTLLEDYQNVVDPNVISFSLLFTNQYVNTSAVSGTITVLGGRPSYIAALVNDTNQADAFWQPYTTSNIVATLGSTNGTYFISVGLRGLPSDASVSWQSVAFIKNTVPPTLTITNPAGSVVSQPVIQLQGYASEPLSSLTFDVSNATGVFTNQPGFLTGQFFDTNLFLCTTNYFLCPDVALDDGLNTITLHATDWAGNVTNISFTLEYSANTNAPALTVIWPPDGTYISDSQFTLQAQVSDPKATVTASIVDASGNTNSVEGLVERSGLVWIQNLPLATGANALTVTTTGTTGNASTTSLTLYQSSVMVTMNPLTSDQLNQSSVTVYGTVSDATAQVYVNGVQASVNDDGTWEADNVPVSPTGTAIFDVEVYNPDMMARARTGLSLRANDLPSGTATGSEQFPQVQPATVVTASYLEVLHMLDGNNKQHYVANWAYNVGGNWVYWGQDIGNEWPFEHTSFSFGGSFSTNGTIRFWPDTSASENSFGPPWSYASYSGALYGAIYDNSTDAKVMIVPSGQQTAVGTNLYLVRACASEFSDPAASVFNPDVLQGGSSGNNGDVHLPPEWLQINKQTLVNSSITNDDGSFWGETVVSGPAGKNVDVTPVATQVYQCEDYTFYVQALDITHILAVDNNRDGQIAFDDSDATTPAKPFRFWVNDSKEGGDDESSGGADDQIPGSSTPNYSWNHPQSRSDYVNFFPVALCLNNILQWLPFTNGIEYHLSQADGAVKIAYTDLTPTNAFDYLTNSASPNDYGAIAGYDPSFSPDSSGAISFTTLDAADLVHVTASGLVLNTNWLAWVQTNGGTGVILMEGCAATTQPLMLEIWQNGQKIGGVPLYLSINGVEQMFRHYNMCAYGNGTVDTGNPGNPSRYDAPNEPVTNGKNLVFLPGYNVNQQQSRGVESEMFKRFYWSGSKAKFYGVTWNGAVSQGDMSLGGVIPQLVNVTCNYQTNVVNALQTASHLADFLIGLPGETMVAAHSLGNMVVLSAISDYSAAPSHYFMIDAAVPMEAIQGDMAYNPDMVYSTWQQYSNRTFASDWWQLFANTDTRNTLTWSNRLGNLGSVDIYNFYSPGEEVLREDTDDPPSGILSGGVTQLINMWAGVAKGAYVWVWQEKGKGNAHFDNFISSTHGGWRFPVNEYGDPIPVPPATANSLPDSTLKQTPVFNFGSYYDQLYGPFPDLVLTNTDGSASTYAQLHRDRILSDAIPALTLPVGANFVSLFNDRAADKRNFNMQVEFETGWPTTRSTGGEAYNWHHSDFDYVAYPFMHKLFDEIVNDGNLKWKP